MNYIINQNMWAVCKSELCQIAQVTQYLVDGVMLIFSEPKNGAGIPLECPKFLSRVTVTE